MLHVAVLPLAVLLQHTLCCCFQVLLAPPHPAAVWACVARFEVWGALIPVAHQQQAREECWSSLDFEQATGGCCSLPPPALIAAMLRFTDHLSDLQDFAAAWLSPVDINSGPVEVNLVFKI